MVLTGDVNLSCFQLVGSTIRNDILKGRNCGPLDQAKESIYLAKQHALLNHPTTPYLTGQRDNCLRIESMQFLIWNILFSSFFILCIKWTQGNRKTDVVTVGAINYIVGAIGAIPYFIQSEPSEFVIHAVWTGSVMGICYFVAFFFLIYAVHWIGASNSSAVSRLSLVIPISAGILLWGEKPSQYQWTGIIIALLSLLLIGRPPVLKKPLLADELASGDEEDKPLLGSAIPPSSTTDSAETPRWVIGLVLSVFFLICGMSRLTQQTCNQLCDSVRDYPTFLISAFVCSGVPSIATLVWRQRRISLLEITTGILLGTANLLQSFLILRCLDVYDGVVVFTITSTVGLAFTTLVAVSLMNEKLSRPSLFGLILACCSIILLHL